MPNYTIQLRPCDAFYFGSERSFGEGEEANYLVHSRKIPQQTSIVGLMRYIILRQKGFDLLGSSSKLDTNASKLIGESSFEIDGDNDFKILQKLSPIYLVKDNKKYFSAPKNYGLKLKAHENSGITYAGHGDKPLLKLVYNSDEKKVFTHKTLLPADDKWIGEDGKEWVETDDIFQAVDQVGIYKTQRRNTDNDDDGFFKMTRYCFKKGYCFEFKVELTEDIFKEEKEIIVHFGGEHSQFYLKAIPDAHLSMPYSLGLVADALSYHQVVLLSDAYIPNEIYQYCDFALTETVDFRFMTTKVTKTEHYHNISGNTSMAKSDKYNLIERGSVFYIPNNHLDDFKSKIDNAAFQKIGYNIYSIIKPLSKTEEKTTI